MKLGNAYTDLRRTAGPVALFALVIAAVAFVAVVAIGIYSQSLLKRVVAEGHLGSMGHSCHQQVRISEPAQQKSSWLAVMIRKKFG